MKDYWINLIQTGNLLTIELGGLCNLSCSFCFNNGGKDIPRTANLNDAMLALMDSNDPPSFVDFFGGEPLIHPDFLPLLRKASALKKRISVATNCLALGSGPMMDRIIDCLGGANCRFRSSLYGIDENTFYLVTGHGGFDRCLNGFKRLVENGFPLTINIVLTRHMLSNLGSAIELLHDLGVPVIKFSGLVETENIENFCPSYSEIRSHLTYAIKISEQAGMQVHIEKLPFCVAPTRIESFVCDRNVSGMSGRMFHLNCSNCMLVSECYGFDASGPVVEGWDVEPIKTLESSIGSILNANEKPSIQPYKHNVLRSMSIVKDYNSLIELHKNASNQMASLIVINKAGHRILMDSLSQRNIKISVD